MPAPAPEPSPYMLLEQSFHDSPKLRHSKQLPRRSDEHRTYSRTAAPLTRDLSYTTTTTTDNDYESAASQQPTPIASPGAVSIGADSGLPPTPPTASQDGHLNQNLEPPPHADSVRNSLISNKSSLSTPVNARSPPTPDPSPPRTNGSANSALDRPPMFPYPSSRAESFRTAQEDLSSNAGSVSMSPVGDRLSTVQEDRGLGLAFERNEEDLTPTNRPGPYFAPTQDTDIVVKTTVDTTAGTTADTAAGAELDKMSPTGEKIPDREWNTDLMRNVTVRRKRDSKPSPRKPAAPAVVIVETALPVECSRTRRTSGLRERVKASSNSPVTPSIEHFAQSIGWPSEGQDTSSPKSRDTASKRMSTSSTSSRVEAMVIMTPPRRNPTLRHSGRNMAYRREISSPAEFGSSIHSNRNSLLLDDVPLHRLVHKRTNIADRSKRISTDSGALGLPPTIGYERNMSPSLSIRSTRTIDSSRHTLAHQESVRRVLQPAADILSRSSTINRSLPPVVSYHRRNTSAPETTRRTLPKPVPRNFSQLSPPTSPPLEHMSSESQSLRRAPSPTLSPKPHLTTPASRKQERTRRCSPVIRHVADTNKTLPSLPAKEVKEPVQQDPVVHDIKPSNEKRVQQDPVVRDIKPSDEKRVQQDPVVRDIKPSDEKRVPSGLMERVRRLVAEQDDTEESTLVPASSPFPASPENLSNFSPSSLQESSPPMRRGSRSSRGRSGERRWSSHSADRTSVSPPFAIRPSLDRLSTEDIARWRRPSEEHARVSFDLSALRSDEHAEARHLYAQGTPFSQMSDTLEVSEATAVSIYPHNNHSLLVVQQIPRASLLVPEPAQLTSTTHLSPEDPRVMQPTPTPPFVDASEGYQENSDQHPQPTLNVEPSTPPMMLDLFQTNGVDSPLKNPRSPPEPPMIMFIPPTPAEELEKQLGPSPTKPGPPKRSDSYPQRRLTLAQRARRYSGNLITPLLARRATYKSRYVSDPHPHTHRNPRIPTVNDGDGSLHPFWRPRGFWDEFDDSDSESDDALPSGGDTSDIEDEDEEFALPRRRNTLQKKLTKSLRGSGGFLIGNSLGVERHGTNKRRHHVTLPANFRKSAGSSERTSSPKVLLKSPTTPLGPHGGSGISKRSSSNSLRSNMSYEAPGRRASWRQGRSLPGIRKYQVQYIGFTGVKDKLKERTAEKRRNKIRQSIGSRYYVDPDAPGST